MTIDTPTKQNMANKLNKYLILKILANLTEEVDNHHNEADDFHCKCHDTDDGKDIGGKNKDNYDSEGAVWFVVATILIYALSIMIMIGANLTRKIQDDEVKNFLKGYTTLNIKKYQKSKVHHALNLKGIEVATPPSTPETLDDEAEGRKTRRIKTRMFNFPIREESVDYEDSSSPTIT